MLSTVDLLVFISLDQVLFVLKILFTFFTKQVTSMRRSTVLTLPLQLGFPGTRYVLFVVSQPMTTWMTRL